MSRQRILIITRNLPPLVGGMERLNWHIADELSHIADVCIIAPAGAAKLAPSRVVVKEVTLRPLSHFLALSAWQAIRLARKWKPQLVLAGSGLTAPAAALAAKVAAARSCVYLHGLDAAVKHAGYRAIWHPAIRKMDCVITNSTPTAELAYKLGISAEKVNIVHPGVALPTKPQSSENLDLWRLRNGLGKARLLLSIGRLTARKGLQEFVKFSLPTIVQHAPDTILVIVGDTPEDALHATMQSRRDIQATANEAGVGHHIKFLGVITNPQELACAYECASLHVFPVRQIEGDPEGFGMVAIEAAAHGRPTVAFATGGVIDSVASGQSGYLVDPGDYHTLATAALQILTDGPQAWQISSSTFAEQFAWPKIGHKLRELIKK